MYNETNMQNKAKNGWFFFCFMYWNQTIPAYEYFTNKL